MLNCGDTIKVYIKRQECGSSMGPSIQGKNEYLTPVVFEYYVHDSNHMACRYLDGTAVGLPIHIDEIVEHTIGKNGDAGYELMKSILKNYAMRGGHHLLKYVTIYNELPGSNLLLEIDLNVCKKYNKTLGIRNNQKFYTNGPFELIFCDAKNKIATIKNKDGKTANVAVHAIMFK